MDAPKPSFAIDIRPMFTDLDVAHMLPAGTDLSSHTGVTANADAIYATVSEGSMPPPSTGEPRWTSEMCETFQRWQAAGCPP